MLVFLSQPSNRMHEEKETRRTVWRNPQSSAAATEDTRPKRAEPNQGISSGWMPQRFDETFSAVTEASYQYTLHWCSAVLVYVLKLISFDGEPTRTYRQRCGSIPQNKEHNRQRIAPQYIICACHVFQRISSYHWLC